MDQQPDTASTDRDTNDATSSQPRSEAPKTRRVRRDRSAGEQAIERIAAAAKALADSERAAAPSSATPAKAKGPEGSPKALIPAYAFKDAPAAARRIRMPTHLPIYAAALCLALGVGGVLGGQFSPAETPVIAEAESAKIDRALPWKREMADAQARDSGKLRDDLRAVRNEVAALRVNSEQLRQSENQKQVQELRAVRATLETQKAETASLKADLVARFDRADKESAQRTDKTVERVDRLERRFSDPVVTGAIVKPAAEPAKPEKQAVRGMVLRDVARGVALIETRRGMMEVIAGDTLPGAGRIEAIEKHAGKWRVVTSTGIIDDQME